MMVAAANHMELTSTLNVYGENTPLKMYCKEC